MGDKRILGIVGGMGPLTTVDFFNKVVNMTHADRDGEHIHVIIDSDAAIPDRTEAILFGDNGCLDAIKRSVKRLIAAGAEVFAMPCNTAHAFFEEIAEAAEGRAFLNMVEATVDAAAATSVKKMGLLATKGTVEAGIYQKKLLERGIKTILPSREGQAEVTGIIYDGIKAGKPYDVTLLKQELDRMMEEGAEMFILGCTELPIAFESYELNYPYIDTARVLAKAAILACGYETI